MSHFLCETNETREILYGKVVSQIKIPCGTSETFKEHLLCFAGFTLVSRCSEDGAKQNSHRENSRILGGVSRVS